jgi:hypothetical protein
MIFSFEFIKITAFPLLRITFCGRKIKPGKFYRKENPRQSRGLSYAD